MKLIFKLYEQDKLKRNMRAETQPKIHSNTGSPFFCFLSKSFIHLFEKEKQKL